MSALTLWQRLALAFVVLLLACFSAAAALQMAHSARYSQQIEQQLLRRLAAYLAMDMDVLPVGGFAPQDPGALRRVVEQLRVTNPGVDLYWLDADGRIQQRYPQTQPLQRDHIAIEPLRDFLAGVAAPILGDDPLSKGGSKVFSVAEKLSEGRTAGYLYAVLQGSAYDMAAADVRRHAAVQTALWSIGMVTPLGLVAGFVAFRWVTRPLARLASDVQSMQALSRTALDPGDAERAPLTHGPRDEIAILRESFDRLAHSNQRHWQSLVHQDRQRREWLAHVSHDLRTPLATVQGCLETVLLKSHLLSESERERYLRTALSESQGLSRLAQALLDVARLEIGAVRPVLEPFSIVELAQDAMQKLDLSASARDKHLIPDFAPGVKAVHADIGMIERVLTNLIDNAIRHTPAGGEIRVRVHNEGDRVQVSVADQGPGIPASLRAGLFVKVSERLPGRDGGGLGLAVVHHILQLHGSTIDLHDAPCGGAVFVFDLPTHP